MIVINQNKDEMTNFNCGVWCINKYNEIVLYTDKPNVYYTFAKYNTREEAEEVFQNFIQSVYDNNDIFNFSYFK